MDCTTTAIVYSKPGCPQCVQAKMLLKSKNICVEEKVIGTDVTIEQLFEHVGQRVGSVPQIFMKGDESDTYIGDFMALRKHLS